MTVTVTAQPTLQRRQIMAQLFREGGETSNVTGMRLPIGEVAQNVILESMLDTLWQGHLDHRQGRLGHAATQHFGQSDAADQSAFIFQNDGGLR